MAAEFALQLAVNNYFLQVCKSLQASGSFCDIQLVLKSLCSFAQLAASSCACIFDVTDAHLASPVAQAEGLVIRECRRVQQHALILRALLFRQLETVAYSLFPGRAKSSSVRSSLRSLATIHDVSAVMLCSAVHHSTEERCCSAPASQPVFRSSCNCCTTSPNSVSTHLPSNSIMSEFRHLFAQTTQAQYET